MDNPFLLEKKAIQIRNGRLGGLVFGLLMALPVAIVGAILLGDVLLKGKWEGLLFVLPIFLLGSGFCWLLPVLMVPELRQLNFLIREKRFQEVIDFARSLQSSPD